MLLDHSPGTNYREGDVFYLDGNKETLIGSVNLFSGITFKTKGTCVPGKMYFTRQINEILQTSDYDSLKSYTPYANGNQLTIVKPLGIKQALTLRLNYSDGTERGSTAFPLVTCENRSILVVATLLEDMRNGRKLKLLSYWTFIEGEVIPAEVALQPTFV